jgi:hypothetical protein
VFPTYIHVPPATPIQTQAINKAIKSTISFIYYCFLSLSLLENQSCKMDERVGWPNLSLFSFATYIHCSIHPLIAAKKTCVKKSMVRGGGERGKVLEGNPTERSLWVDEDTANAGGHGGTERESIGRGEN